MAIRCSCKRDNEPGRRFCGGCGVGLSPACTSCGFVNTLIDRFCGGCGATTAPRTAPPKPPPRKGKTVPIDRIDDAVLSETRLQVDETW